MSDNSPRGSGLQIPGNVTAQGNPYSSFMSQKERAKDFSEFPSASFEQRLLAFTIDILLITLVGRILAGVLGETLAVNAVVNLGTLIYFIFTQLKYQRTLGKHVMGLRVVSHDPMQPMTLGRMILREVIGRSVSMLILMIGYLMVLFHPERRALHDVFSDTTVVSLKPVKDVPIMLQAARGFGVLAGIAVMMGIGFYYAIFYTTFPLERLQRSYYAKGVRMKGISGNITNGFLVKQIDWEKQGESIHLENLFVDIEPDILALGDGQVHIRKLSVANARAVVVRDQKAVDDANAAQGEEAAADAGGAAIVEESTGFRFIFDEMDLNNLKLVFDGKEFQISRFFLKDLDYGTSSMKLGRIYIDSPDAAFDSADFEMTGDHVKVGSPMQLMVKKELIPDILKANVDLKMQFDGVWPEMNVQASGFQNKLKIDRKDSGTEVSLNDWSPGHYMKGYWPVHRMQFGFKGRGDIKTMLLTTPLTGSLNLHHVPFQLVEGQSFLTVVAGGLRYRHQRGNFESQMAIQLVGSAEAAPWMAMSSTLQMGEVGQELAMLYFGQPLMALNETQKNRIAADLKFFSEPLFKKEALGKLAEISLPDQSPAAEDSVDDPLQETFIQRQPSNE